MTDGPYEQWVIALRRWRTDPSHGLGDVPALTAESFPPSAYARLLDHLDSATFHPTFLYEMLWDFAAAAVLVYLIERRLRPRPPGVFAAYIALYCVGRFGEELLRIDPAHHIAGLRLRVRGIPFQQQEQAVGACATTAIWSTLARVMRSDGGRAPTPFAVTEAATKHFLSDRAFPASSGLEPRQILEAFRQFGYSPLYFEPKKEHAQFQLAVSVMRQMLKPGA